MAPRLVNGQNNKIATERREHNR